MIKAIFRLIKEFWKLILTFLAGRNKPFKTVRISELPDNLKNNTVYIMGEGEHLWHAVMTCPCGCGAKIYASLLEDDKPYWQLTQHEDGTISLHPSIWRTKGCESHFFLKNGFIHWVNPQ